MNILQEKRRCMGHHRPHWGGDSESSSSTTTNNQDNRLAVQDGIAIGTGGSYSNWDKSISQVQANTETTLSNSTTTNITELDNGVIQDAFRFGEKAFAFAGGTVGDAFEANQLALSSAIGANQNAFNSALSSIDRSNATLGAGFSQLLNASRDLFAGGSSLIDKTQKAVAGAYSDAQNTAKGTIDNRTIVILALAGAAVIAVIAWKK